MGIPITSGTGTPYDAKVDQDNLLHVKSHTVNVEQFAADGGSAFIIHVECELAATTTGGFLYFKNTSTTKHVHITRIFVDPHLLTDSLIIRQIFNPTLGGSGTTSTTTGLVQKNLQRGITLDGSLTYSEGANDMTLSGGTQYHAFPVESLKQYHRDMQASNILGTNDAVGWSWATTDGANAVDGEKVSFSVNVILEDIEN